MTRGNALTQLVLARIKEFFREPSTIFWVYGFPLILAMILGVAFSNAKPEPPRVDVVESARAAEVAKILEDAKIKVTVASRTESEDRLQKGKTTLIIVPRDAGGFDFRYDEMRPESFNARQQVEAVLLRAAAGDRAPTIEPDLVTERGSTYIDFLLPGLVGINIMGGGLFGIGFVLVDMRVRKLFKRLMATPMHRGDFLWSLILSRLLFLAPEMTSLLIVARLLFGVPIKGSPIALALAVVMGSLAFSGIGLLLGSRTEKTETISGLLNLVMLPMYLVSGVFFSSRQFPEAAQPFIQALPLTQLIDALREVMLEGADVSAIAWRLGILAIWGGTTFAIALRIFKWT